MAEVDFSNAKIEPVDIWQSQYVMYNPTANEYLGLASSYHTRLYDSNQQQISSTFTRTQLINQSKQFMYIYQGVFSASGTEFYILGDNVVWRVYNISFQSGDSYVFQINASLICN